MKNGNRIIEFKIDGLYQQTFAKSHLAKALGINTSTLNKRINNNQLPAPTGENNKFLWKDLKKIFYDSGFVPILDLDHSSRKYYTETKEFILIELLGGVFLSSSSSNKKQLDKRRDTIKSVGLWNAQGLNNHIHLNDFSSNKAIQIYLAQDLINGWLRKLSDVRSHKKIIISIHGTNEINTCIYLRPPDNDAGFKEYIHRAQFRRVKNREFELSNDVTINLFKDL